MKYDLERFTSAQSEWYEVALNELQKGKKESHWMWFIFPQIEGLGQSDKSIYYSIKNLEHASDYLMHPVLGSRLVESCECLLGIDNRSAEDVFGFPDYLKLNSSLTLFSKVPETNPVFAQLIDKWFNGQLDGKTIELLC